MQPSRAPVSSSATLRDSADEPGARNLSAGTFRHISLRFRNLGGAFESLILKEAMNPVTQEARKTAFQQTLVSARQTMLMSEILKMAMDSFRASKTRFMLT